MVGREDPVVPEALERFMQDFPDKKRAVFAVNTHTLFLTLKEVERRKLRMPEDIGVCGYDAVGWSELVYPGISSIRQPMDQMGVNAGELIVHCVREGVMPHEYRALDGTLTFRNSTQFK